MGDESPTGLRGSTKRRVGFVFPVWSSPISSFGGECVQGVPLFVASVVLVVQRSNGLYTGLRLTNSQHSPRCFGLHPFFNVFYKGRNREGRTIVNVESSFSTYSPSLLVYDRRLVHPMLGAGLSSARVMFGDT